MFSKTVLLATYAAAVLATSAQAQSLSVGSAANHTCVVNDVGGVKCWGANDWGQLGDGTRIDSATPVDVVGLSAGVVTIATGQISTCALTTAGGVKCWGAGYSGQLGDGTKTSRATPTDVSGLTSGVTALAVGRTHACGVASGGALKCWGSNDWGELGDGTSGVVRSAPVDVVGLSSGVQAVGAGWSHTCAITAGGGVMCWGLANGAGNLGDGTTNSSKTPVQVVGLTSGVKTVGAGEAHTCALTVAGGVKCWGSNNSGKLGNNSGRDMSVPVDVVGMASGIEVLAVGNTHTCALAIGGDVKCWGMNTSGQLGDGTVLLRPKPVAVLGLATGSTSLTTGFTHTCVTLKGSVLCWGANTLQQVGLQAHVVAPTVTTQPASRAVTSGDTVSFTAEASGVPLPTVTWHVKTIGGAWSSISGATSTTYSLTASESDAGSQYRAVFTNAGGTATSDGATLTVAPLPGQPAITVQPSQQTVPPGGTASFVVSAVGNPAPTLRWHVSRDNGATWAALVDAAPYQGVATSTLQVASATVDPNALYRAVATNSVGSVASVPVRLEVNTLGHYLAVMRVVTADWVTDQYNTVSWERAALIKSTADFQWFEATIWKERNAVHLYKFDASFDPSAGATMPTDQWIAYRESYRLQKFDLSSAATSDERSHLLRDAFAAFFETMVTTTPSRHYGVRYSGHGSGDGGLFQRQVTPADARALLSHAIGLIGRRLDFVDLGGNCSEGVLAVLNSFSPYFEYGVASDLPIGGDTLDVWSTEQFYEINPDYQLPLILTPNRSIKDGLVKYLDLARRTWEYSRRNMIASLNKQSLSLYQMDQFSGLAQLVSPLLSGSATAAPDFHYDLLGFIQSLHRGDIESAFAALRIDYRSNKDFFAWDVDSNGLAFYSSNDLVGCRISVSPTTQNVGSAGGTGSVTVSASSSGCPWTAQSSAPEWLAVTAGGSGSSSGSVTYSVSPNQGGGRTGSITIGGSTLTLNQSASTGVVTITWPSPAAITVGTALSAAQLNATASVGGGTVAGALVYTPPAGTVLSAGAGQTLSVTFTPTDTATYATVTKTVTIDVTNQAGTRTLPVCYAPGYAVAATVAVGPAPSVQAYAMADQPPAGWTLGAISDGGIWDATTSQIKWGPFFDAAARTVTYLVTPPADASAVVTFAGVTSFDGSDVPVGGSKTLARCELHPADANGDGRLVISEVTGYGAAWKKGTTWATPPTSIPIGYLTRAGYLWKTGETYRRDAGPTAAACPSCWVPLTAAPLPVPEMLLLIEAVEPPPAVARFTPMCRIPIP